MNEPERSSVTQILQAVEAGDAVQGGQAVGRVGETGPLGRPGLYFEIRVDGAPVDPEDWLRP